MESTYAPGWAEAAIEDACERTARWFGSVIPFPSRVNLGSVVGYRAPALLSERDCVIAFIRSLIEGGLPWDAIHSEVSISRWIFEAPHPAATATSKSGLRRRIDLVLVDPAELLAAQLPVTDAAFQFAGFLEFGYLTDYWRQPKARIFNKDPVGGRDKVAADVEKIAAHLLAGACGCGYVIVFEECDYGFEREYAAQVEAETGCRVRFIRAWPES